MKTYSRKQFLQASLLTGGAALLARTRSVASVKPGRSPNGDVRVGVIGFNGQGSGHVKDYFKMPGAQLVALCDVDPNVMSKHVALAEKANVKVTQYRDFRKLLESPDIDAVVIATPNHWHSLMTILACQAGKDVYVEKPLSNNVWEGRKAVEAAKKYHRIVQIGTQNRSSLDIQETIAYIRAGKLGKIQWARGLCYKDRPSIGRCGGPQPIPAGVEYDLWSGPAPLVAPRRNGSRGPLHYDWHWFWNYGGGDIANQGIHQMDIARWILGEPGLPPTVFSVGGRYGYVDDAETPNTQIVTLGYEKAPLIFEVRGLPAKTGMKAMDAYRGSRVGVVVQCEGGYVVVSESGTVVINDNSDKRITQFANGGSVAHRKNFIDAVRSRKEADLAGKIEPGHYSSALCHLGNISYCLGTEKSMETAMQMVESDAVTKETLARTMTHLEANSVDTKTTPMVVGPTLKLEPMTEKFVTKEKYDAGYFANAMLRRQGRPPFVVPDKV